MQRRAPLAARLSKRKRAAVELEKRQRIARLLAGPVQPPGDHQVQDEEEIALQADDDAFSEAGQRQYLLAYHLADRWHCGAKQERIEELNLLQPRAADQPLEAFQIDGDIGQLGHETLGKWDESR